MARFGELAEDARAGTGTPTVTFTSASALAAARVDSISASDIDRIVSWLSRADSTSECEDSEQTSVRLRSWLLTSPFGFLGAFLHQLPPDLLALLPVSPSERAANREIAARRRVYARLHAPDELSGAGAKDRLSVLWLRYSEGRSSVERVEAERAWRVRRQVRAEEKKEEEKARRAADRVAGYGEGKAQAGTEELAGEIPDLVGLAAARHPSLGEYFDGADDPRAAAAEGGAVETAGVQIDEEDEEEEEEEADQAGLEFDIAAGGWSPGTERDGEGDGMRRAKRRPPAETGEVALSAFSRHVLRLFLAGTDPTLPRSLYDAVDFDDQWDPRVEDDDDGRADLGGVGGSDGQRRGTPAQAHAQGRPGAMRGYTIEDAYFDGDDE